MEMMRKVKDNEELFGNLIFGSAFNETFSSLELIIYIGEIEKRPRV